MSNKKKTIIKQEYLQRYSIGSSEMQIIIFTHRIKKLTEHIKKNKKDKHSHRGLIRIVNKRKYLISYLRNSNLSKLDDVLRII